jgi:thermitase
MKRIILVFILIATMILLLPAGATYTNGYINKSRYAADHIILKLKTEQVVLAAASSQRETDIKNIELLASRTGIKIINYKKLFPSDLYHHSDLAIKYELKKFYIVYIESDKDIRDVCKEYEKYPFVDYAEPDFIGEAAGERTTGIMALIKPNDEFYNRQWALNNIGTIRTTLGKPGKKGADINAEKGWDVETGSDTVIVGILDSGSKLDHPDLSGRFWRNTKETKNGKDDDGNGFVDDINGWNFAYDNSNVTDDGGHGTNISGTIAAVPNNSIGYAGVDWKCKIMICKNLDDENLGEYSWWSASLYYAANNGANIVNMSEGGYDYSKTLETAVNYAYDAGCLIMASMMNKNNNDTYYPAAYTNVMAIGATDADDGRCKQFTWGGGSNWGQHICVVAPGNRIYGLDYKDDYNYDIYWSGTSQATAYVSGIAALLLAQDKTRTNKELKDIITSTAKDMVGDSDEDTPGWDEYYGFGRVDLYAALTYGKSPVDIKDNNNSGRNVNTNKDNPVDRQAKSVDRNSKNQDNSDKDRPARKVEH